MSLKYLFNKYPHTNLHFDNFAFFIFYLLYNFTLLPLLSKNNPYFC